MFLKNLSLCNTKRMIKYRLDKAIRDRKEVIDPGSSMCCSSSRSYVQFNERSFQLMDEQQMLFEDIVGGHISPGARRVSHKLPLIK